MIQLSEFLKDFDCAVTSPHLKDHVESAWDDIASAWDAADEAQKVQIEIFWQHYQPTPPNTMEDVRELKKVCKIIINFVALQAPESLLDEAGVPLNV